MKLKELLKYYETAKALDGVLMLDFHGSVFVNINKNGDIELGTALNTAEGDWEFYSGKEGDSLRRPRVWSEKHNGISMKEARRRLT